MIEVYCDYCKRKIESSNEQVNLDFNAYGCTGFPTDMEYQLHVECAYRVKNKLEGIMNREEHETKEGERCESAENYDNGE